MRHWSLILSRLQTIAKIEKTTTAAIFCGNVERVTSINTVTPEDFGTRVWASKKLKAEGKGKLWDARRHLVACWLSRWQLRA
jgi:hypothetical protein